MVFTKPVGKKEEEKKRLRVILNEFGTQQRIVNESHCDKKAGVSMGI